MSGRAIPPKRHLPPWAPLLDARRGTVLRIPGVVGVGIAGGPGRERVVVTVAARAQETDALVLAALDGLDVGVEIETGEPFFPLPGTAADLPRGWLRRVAKRIAQAFQGKDAVGD